MTQDIWQLHKPSASIMLDNVGSSSHPAQSASNDHWESAQEGMELLREGEIKKAIALLSQVVIAEPRNEYAHFFLGNGYYEEDNFALALKHYLRAVEIEPLYTAALVNAGHALHRLSRYHEAIRVGKQVLARDPNDADGLYLLGIVYYTMGDHREARRYLTKFTETQPEFEVLADVQALLEQLGGRWVDPALDESLNDQLN